MLKFYIILITVIIIIEIILNAEILNFITKSNAKMAKMNLKLKNDFNKQLLNLKKSIKNKNIKNEEFNEIIYYPKLKIFPINFVLGEKITSK